MFIEKRECSINKFNIQYTTIKFVNQNNMEVILSSFGAGIKSIKVFDKNHNLKEMTLCPEDERMYYYVPHGKTIGRTSGRIRNATFKIDGRVALLEKNNFGKDNLHGGKEGLSHKNFDYQIRSYQDYCEVIFHYFSKDQEGGYFGDVDIKVTYQIKEQGNVIRIIFDGTCDCKNLLNLTNHTYFNISGNPFSPVGEQELFINASHYGDLSKRLIVKSIKPVCKELDFRNPHLIGDYIDSEFLSSKTNGYDHHFFLDREDINTLSASLKSNESGIKLNIYTSYPCIVLYAPKRSEKSFIIDGIDYSLLSSCCLECQFHSDGIHRLKNRNGVFTPEKPYHEIIEFHFDYI